MGWLNKKYPVAQAGISKTIQQELEWREEELNAPPARRKIHNLKDNRKTRATTNKPINPNVDLVSGKFSLQPLNDLMHYAKKQGLSKEDMYNLAAIDLQETRWGATDNQTGHVQGDYGKENLSENFVEAYKYKMKEADRLGISDPAERLQVYNGRGKIFPDTEEDYHGFKMKKIYGVPVPKEGLDLRKDPLYGKQILDIRDNVLKKNAWLTEYVDSVDASRTAPYKKLQPYSIDTHWARNDIPQEPDSMQDGGWLDAMAQDGKSSIKVQSKNDPIYKAYQDSLALYDASQAVFANKKAPELELHKQYKILEDKGLDFWWMRMHAPPKLRSIEDPIKGGTLAVPEHPKPTGIKKPRKPEAKTIKDKTAGLKKIETKEATIREKSKLPKAKIPKSYNTFQQHEGYSMENRSNTPEETERLVDEYDRFKDIKGGPRLKVTPKYQDGGWLDAMDGGIIEGQRGQWDNPGEVTRIQGGNITMKADPLNGKQLTQPLMGISDKGERQMMYPGEDYSFKDAEYVTEYPIAQNGTEDGPYEPLTTGTNWLDEVVVSGKTTPMARMISKYTPGSETAGDVPVENFKEYKPIAQDTHANTDSFVKQKAFLKKQNVDLTDAKKSPEENTAAWKKLEEDMRVQNTDYVDPIITKDFVESSNKYAREAEIADTRSFEDYYKKTPEEVKELQIELKDKGYNLGPRDIDSMYGTYTDKAYTSMLEDERLDDSTISKYYKKYSPTTSNNVKEIQRKLIDEGFLTEKSKYGRDNIDGKFGNLTKEALMDYNSSKNEEDLKGLVFDIIPQTIEEPRCAAGMCNILEMNNVETQAVGIKYKDAWDLHENMIEADNSEQIFNIYDDPAFANINESTPIEELKRITREVKRKKQTKASHYKVGDIIGIYWPESKYHAKTLKSKTYNTHSGFVSSIENGIPIITHNLNGNIKNQPFNEVNTAWISRPNDNVVINSTYNEQLDSDALSSTVINPSLLRNLEQKKERPLTTKEKTITSNIMQRSQYNSTHIPEILNSTVDSNWLDAATFAITGVETGGGVSAPRTREDVDGLRGIAHNIKGTKDSDISLGVGKVKFGLLDNFAKTYFDINSPKDLADDNKSIDVISYLLTKNYELFKDYAIQYPELGLKEEDLRNMSILSHNQGNSRLLRTGRSKTNPMTSEEELKELRKLYEGTVADISSTNYSKVPIVGKAAYKAALAVGKEKPGERYISKVNRYIEEVYNIPDKRMALSTEESGGWLDNIN